MYKYIIKPSLHILCGACLMVIAIFNTCNAQKTDPPTPIVKQFYDEQEKIGEQFNTYINNNFQQLYGLPQQAFTERVDSLHSIYQRHLHSYEGKLNAKTFASEEMSIRVSFDRFILRYPILHEEFTDNPVNLSPQNQARLAHNTPYFNSSEALENEAFHSYAQTWISLRSQEILSSSNRYEHEDNQQLRANWGVIDSAFSNVAIKNYWRYTYLLDHIENYGIRNIESFYDQYIANATNADHKATVTEKYDAHLKARQAHLIEIYKSVDGFELEMHLFLPDSTTEPRPAIVYFHGGSWSQGKPDYFFKTGEQYAREGWVAAAVEYRIKGRHGTYPFEAVKDAKSAIRWLRSHASQYNIDPEKIIATGNSAGGHLAIAAVLTDQWNTPTDDLSVSPIPNVVIANSAVYDLTVRNSQWIVEKMEDKEVVKEISPNSLIAPTATKFLLIHGENDRRCEYQTAQYFYEEMESAGNTVELHKIDGAHHFIWYGKYSAEVEKITKEYIELLDY